MAYCYPCNRSFGSQSALDQHLSSPAHAPEFPCNDCAKSFGSQSALDQHLSSPAHALTPSSTDLSPLDQFFHSFPAFPYDPSHPPQEEYRRLQRCYRWVRNDPDGEDAWMRYRSALVREFNRWYGEEDNLSAWQSLCRAVAVFPVPQNLPDCRFVSVRPTQFPNHRANNTCYYRKSEHSMSIW